MEIVKEIVMHVRFEKKQKHTNLIDEGIFPL